MKPSQRVTGWAETKGKTMNKIDKINRSWENIVVACKNTRHSVSVSTANRRAAILEIDRRLTRYAAIEEAAIKLHEKMLRVYESDEYKSVWSFYWSHAGNYKGESWQEEQSALATALNNPR